MNGEFIKTIIIAIIGSGAFSGCVAAIVNSIHDRKKKESAEEAARSDAIMYLLAGQIRTECQEYINAGEIDIEDLKRLEKAWTIYHDKLGGNGFLDTVMTNIKHLPLKKTY